MPVASNTNCLRPKQNCGYPARSNHRDGLTAECICPKCGAAHRMKLVWSGRGKPKKYCPPCKNFVASMEVIDFGSLPTVIHKGIEKVI